MPAVTVLRVSPSITQAFDASKFPSLRLLHLGLDLDRTLSTPEWFLQRVTSMEVADISLRADLKPLLRCTRLERLQYVSLGSPEAHKSLANRLAGLHSFKLPLRTLEISGNSVFASADVRTALAPLLPALEVLTLRLDPSPIRVRVDPKVVADLAARVPSLVFKDWGFSHADCLALLPKGFPRNVSFHRCAIDVLVNELEGWYTETTRHDVSVFRKFEKEVIAPRRADFESAFGRLKLPIGCPGCKQVRGFSGLF
jgi:hypothetical protein